MTLAPFDPLVADVLMDLDTTWEVSMQAWLRRGVLYPFTKQEEDRAMRYFQRLLKKPVRVW
jgi:hypothetical protein